MGRNEEDLKDFALGGRRIPWWAVLASIIAAETSAGTFFGTPGEGFALRNYTYLQLALGTILARVLVSYIFIKPYYDYKVYSIYEYLTARFGVPTKNAASTVFMITRLLASGARLYVANGLSDDMTVIDVASAKALKTIPVGRVPYAVLIDD